MVSKNTDANKQVTLWIEFPNTSFIEGQEISGYIHLSLKINLPQSTLFLIFKGKEQTHWTEVKKQSVMVNGKLQNTFTDQSFEATEKICNFEYPIYQWTASVPAGTYSIPFTFVLPLNIPSSFFYSQGPVLGKIEYKFHSKIVSENGKKFKARVPVFISTLETDTNENLRTLKKARLKAWCTKEKGQCNLSLIHKQHTYSHSQVITLAVEIDNSESKLNISGIRCEIFYMLRFRCKGPTSYFNKEVLVSQSYPINISAGETFSERSILEIKINLASRIGKLVSTIGKIVECAFTVRVEAETNGYLMCCGQYPCLEVPIKIVEDSEIKPQDTIQIKNSNFLSTINVIYDEKFEKK